MIWLFLIHQPFIEVVLMVAPKDGVHSCTKSKSGSFTIHWGDLKGTSQGWVHVIKVKEGGKKSWKII
jgi:hypothetical protein